MFLLMLVFSRPGRSQGLLYKHLRHYSVSDPLVKIYLRRRHALMVEDGAFSHKIDYVTIFKKILNRKGHQNRITGLKVMAILLNG